MNGSNSILTAAEGIFDAFPAPPRVLPVLAFVFLLVLSALILYGVRLKAKIMLRGRFCDIKLTIILFFGIIRINLRYSIEYEPFNGINVYRLISGRLKRLRPRKERAKRGRLAKKMLHALPNALSVKEFELAGEVGRGGDAFLSVFLCGAFSVLSEALLRIVFGILIKSGSEKLYIVNVFPVPSRTAFNLNLAGIVRLNLIKLLLNVFIRKGNAE